MSFGQYGGNLIDFNKSGAFAIGIINPLAAQLDFSLFGSIGLGAIQANLSAQLSSVLQASFDIGLNIANPFIGFQLALTGAAALMAQITAALSGAIPAVSIEATGQLAANAALIGILELQIGGLQALIDGMLQLKMPAVQLATDFAAALALGPIQVLGWELETIAAVKARIDTLGFVGPTYGVFIATTSSPVWGGGLKFFFNTGL